MKLHQSTKHCLGVAWLKTDLLLSQHDIYIYIYIFPVLLWDGECGWDGADCPGIHNPDLLIYSVNSRGWRGEGGGGCVQLQQS